MALILKFIVGGDVELLIATSTIKNQIYASPDNLYHVIAFF